MKSFYYFSLAAAMLTGANLPLFAQTHDKVAGNLILFQENGGWCWYQDERVLVDAKAGKIVFNAIQNYAGVGGKPVDGNIYAGSLDLQSHNRSLFLLAHLPSYNSGDDHNVAALWMRPDGRYLAAYCGHNDANDAARMRITSQPGDVNVWGDEFIFNWTTGGGKDGNVTYNNLHFLADEGDGKGRLYNITRQWQRSPIIGFSHDWGETWKYGGALTIPKKSKGYSNGYYKFTSNGADRIDFIATEGHPRDYNTSIYHGYIKGGHSYNSQGTVIDEDIFDQNAPEPAQFTPVFKASPEDKNMDESEYHRAWTVDLELDAAGNPVALFTTRYGTKVSSKASGDGDHRLFYARYIPGEKKWAHTELCKMGIPLDPREEDYTGLGAIHPNRPMVFVSTPFDPSTGTATQKWEIYQGESPDNGATWKWTTITSNSSLDNLRPVVPSWDASNTAVLWLRGEYVWQHIHDQSVVGLVRREGEVTGRSAYLDATASNTALTAGGSLNATGPGSAMGGKDGLWHWRTGYGNGGSVLTSAETGGENAPALRSKFEGLKPGTYRVWVNFWANPQADWRIRGGFSADKALLFRHKACQQVNSSAYDSPIISANSESNIFLYQGYLGRTEIDAGGVLEVVVDDDAVKTGTASILIGSDARTWYDGVSVSLLNPENAVRFDGGKSTPYLYYAANTVTIVVAHAGSYSLSVLGLDGSFICSLFDGYLHGGRQTIHWEGPKTKKGLFILRMEKVGKHSEKSVVVVNKLFFK